MPEKTRKGHGGIRKYGRKLRKPSHQRYNAEDRRYKNKLRRILKSSGPKAAKAYRMRHLRRISGVEA